MLLDDKGRVKGKINIVDLTAILLVFLLVFGVIYKFTFGSNGGGYKGNTYTVYLRIRVPNRDPGDVKLLKVGDRLITGTQEVDSWIKRIEFAPYYIRVDDAQGIPHKRVHPFRKDIIITIRSEVPLDDKLTYLRVGNQDGLVNTYYGIKTRNTTLKGYIIDVREEKPAK